MADGGEIAALSDTVHRLQKRLDRERAARSAAEKIAEDGLRTLYEEQNYLRIFEAVVNATNTKASIDACLRFTIEQICTHAGWSLGHVYKRRVRAICTQLVSTNIWHESCAGRFEVFKRGSKATPILIGIGLPGRVWLRGEAVWEHDVLLSPCFPRRRYAEACGIRSAFAFPVIVNDQVVSVVEFFSTAVQPDNARFRELSAQISRQLGRNYERLTAIRRLRAKNVRLKAVLLDAEEHRKAAEAANASKSSFLATVSHEIRTPMNGVLGMVQVMQGERLSKRQRDRLEQIGQSGEMLLAILNDVLDLSKIEAGKLELEETDFDLARQAYNVVSTFKPMASAKGLELTLEVTPQATGVFRGDAVRVRQILFNLVSNALKFTSAGSVRVRLGFAGSSVRLSVADTGLGMEPDQIGRLFEKFVQADASTTRRFGGTGLGLSICRELCAAMGGRITAQSEIGQGSDFTVELPLPRFGELSAAESSAPKPAAALDNGTLRILAAEDNPVNRMVLRAVLQQAEIEPVIVNDGAEVVAAWEAGEWDLILMDVQMPVMDGATATGLIRRREMETGRQPIPIIALTANAMKHQADSYLTIGMTGFVAKPIMIAELFAAINDALLPASEGHNKEAAADGDRLGITPTA